MDLDIEDNSAVFYMIDGDEKIEYALASNISINAVNNAFLSIDFKEAIVHAIENGDTSFTMPDNNECRSRI